MAKFNAKKAYLDIKSGNNQKYQEEKHCVMILNIMNTEGTNAAFCKEAAISDSTFYSWTHRYPVFDECYRLGAMLSKQNWEEEGKNNKDNPEFNSDYWKTIGNARYGLGKTARIRVGVTKGASPYNQYQQIMKQASEGEFTATELKLLMESISAGTRAFESYELQKQVSEMKDDLRKMEAHSGNNIIPIDSASKAN